MNKIKKMFSGMVNSVKETLKQFPVTTVLIFIITLVTAFLVIDTDFSEAVDEIIAHVLCICGFTAVGSWFVEAIFTEKTDTRRFIGYVISFIISIVFDRILKLELFEESFRERLVIEYIIACFLATVYVLAGKVKDRFEKYILNLILNLKRATIICGIISIGFLILYAIFTILILDSLEFTIVARILCLFAGFYYVPVVIKSFAGEDAEDTKFNKAVFSKVLLFLITLAMAIIYIYIAKIFLITEVPKNELFGILSMIFVCSYPVYVVNKNYSEKGSFIYKINNAIPYLFIPFIFLQIYAMGIRILQYGLTDSRYMACVLVVYEIVAIVLAITSESKHLKENILSALVISVVITITPLNFDSLPKLNQKSIVDKYVEQGVEFDSLSEEDKKKFAGAYQYIENDEKYVNEKLTQIEKEKLSSYSTYRYSHNYDEKNESEIQNIYLRKDFDNVDISKYSRVYEIPYSFKSNGAVVDYNDEIQFKVDLKDYASQIIEANETSEATADRVFEEIEVVKVDETRDIFLTEFSTEYNRKTKEIEYVRIEGYLLQK